MLFPLIPLSKKSEDTVADLIVALSEMVIELALAIPYGKWEHKLTHPLRKFGIGKGEWEDGS